MLASGLIYQNFTNRPAATAITFLENNRWQTISWQELGSRVCRTANGLKSIGVKKQDTVGIYSQNSEDWIIMDLATQLLGAISVPVYATDSFEQLKFITTQTKCDYILAGNEAQLEFVKKLRTETGRPLQIFTSFHTDEPFTHQLSEWSKQFSANFIYIQPDAEDLFTIIYTSGTTGVAKGVMLTYGNFSSVVQSHKIRFHIDNMHDVRSMAFLPLSHVFERAWSNFVLSQGGEVIVLDNPKNVQVALQETKPTALCAVPRFYEKIYNTITTAIKNSSPLKKLLFSKALYVGKKYAEKKRKGEKIPSGLKLQFNIFDRFVFKKVKDNFGGKLSFLPVGGAMIEKEITEFMDAIGMPVIVGYGLTETSATVTCYPEKNYVHGSVGRVLSGTEIKIGENDEILVKSGIVMKGYYKNEEETRKVFTEDGYFRTGDCGRIDEKGNLFITDRIKDLMKTSNGKYIVPQPIEVSLQTSPEIAQAMVIADAKPFVTSLIVPDFETLAIDHPDFKTFHHLDDEAKNNLLNSAHIKEKFRMIIEEIQHKSSSFEKIRHFRLLPEAFTIENGELTPTLKIKRAVVLAKMKPIIDGMYLAERV